MYGEYTRHSLLWASCKSLGIRSQGQPPGPRGLRSSSRARSVPALVEAEQAKPVPEMQKRLGSRAATAALIVRRAGRTDPERHAGTATTAVASAAAAPRAARQGAAQAYSMEFFGYGRKTTPQKSAGPAAALQEIMQQEFEIDAVGSEFMPSLRSTTSTWSPTRRPAPRATSRRSRYLLVEEAARRSGLLRCRLPWSESKLRNASTTGPRTTTEMRRRRWRR